MTTVFCVIVAYIIAGILTTCIIAFRESDNLRELDGADWAFIAIFWPMMLKDYLNGEM